MNWPIDLPMRKHISFGACNKLKNKYYKDKCTLLFMRLSNRKCIYFGQTYYRRLDWKTNNVGTKWYVAERISPEEMTFRILSGHKIPDHDGKV